MDNSILKEELDKSQNVHNVSALEIDGNNNKANRMILSEIQEIRKELEYQRELINDFKYTKNSLEHQIKDLERIYHDELRQNADFASRHDQMANTMKKYRDSYVLINNFLIFRINLIDSIKSSQMAMREQERSLTLSETHLLLSKVSKHFLYYREDNFRRDRRYSPSPQHYQRRT